MILPASSLSVLRLVDRFGDGILEGAPQEIRDLAELEWGFETFADDELEFAQSHPAWSAMYPFQREAIEYLFCNPHAASLLGLSPGLGKAAVSIIAADLLEHSRVLILAPLTLAVNWEREFDRWSKWDRSVQRATAADREPTADVVVCNHEVIQEVVLRDEDGNVFQPEWVTNARRVKAWREEGPTIRNKAGKPELARARVVRVRRDYRDRDWDLVIVDESILLKNRRAVKTDVLAALRKAHGGHVWELSGSPTAKFRDDLFRQLQILAPRMFTAYWRFTEFFCDVERGQWGWKVAGDRPEIDVHSYLRDFVFIRSQEDVLPDLPDYIERSLVLEAPAKQRKALDQMTEEWRADLEDAPDDPVEAETWLAYLTRYMQITSNLGTLPLRTKEGFHKRSSIKEDALADLIEQGDVEFPLLVWTWFVEATHSIAERLEKLGLNVGHVTGRTNRAVKDSTLEAYRVGDLDALVLQMGVGKYGHTFTNTRTVYYHDRAFDSDAWIQSLKRVRRIGLDHRPVLIVPRVENSADDLIDANLAGKIRSIADMTRAELAALLPASA